VKQARAESRLELRDPGRDHRARHPERIGGARKAPELGDAREHPDRVQLVHNSFFTNDLFVSRQFIRL
jgi:hypothetical protein